VVRVDYIKCVIGWLMPIQRLLIQNTLDVMHIEENVCESVIKFVIGVKDTFKVRRDMDVWGLRPLMAKETLIIQARSSNLLLHMC
jgi:hypothetical protein